MFERFTSRARHVVVLAQEEARRMPHNYIGTEHLLLGLLGESGGLACRVLQGFGMSLESCREEVAAIVGTGKVMPQVHIPFTPRAKKTLELALREALQLGHDHIGTEHILLGLIREGDGVAARVMRQHGDLLVIRTAVLDALPPVSLETSRGRRWLRRRAVAAAEAGVDVEQAMLSASPAADSTLSEASRLAAGQPVGSHHLLLAALADQESAAAKALASLGVNLEQAKDALRAMDVTGTSDEQPEEAGRRQLVVHVADDRLTVELTDPAILKVARAAVAALGDQADPPGTIRGDLPACASLAGTWQALHNSLEAIQRRARASDQEPGEAAAEGTDAA